MNTVRIKVDGMTCTSCTRAVENALRAVDGTQHVAVSLDEGTAILQYPGPDYSILVDAVINNTGKGASLISTTPLQTDQQHISIRIQGMTCKSCVKNVTNALNSIEESQNVVVSLAEGIATLDYCGSEFDMFSTDREDNIFTKAIKEKAHKKAVVIDAPSNPSQPLFVQLSVKGMSCQSCVKKVRDVLDATPGVSQIDVSLADETATFKFSGDKQDQEALASLVTEKAKKKATLIQSFSSKPVSFHLPNSLSSSKSSVPVLTSKSETVLTTSPTSDLRRMALKVEGMTCMSCVNNVRKSLESLEYTDDVEVSLGDGTVSLTYTGEDESVLLDAVAAAGKKASFLEESAVQSRLVRLIDTNIDNDSSLKNGSSILTVSGKHTMDFINEKNLDDGVFTIDDEEEEEEEVEQNDEAVTRLRVVGMVCTACSGAIEHALLDLEGVNSVAVLVFGGRAKVRHSPALDTNLLTEAIVRCGFDAKVIATKMPGEEYVLNENLPTEFRIDFGSQEQALKAYASLKKEESVNLVEYSGRTVSIQLNRGKMKSSLLLSLERNGSYGVMKVRPSEKAEKEAQSLGAYAGATDVIDEEAYMWKKRFISAVSFFFIIMAVEWVHDSNPTLFSSDELNWFECFLATPVQFISGYGFYRGSYYSVRKGRATMDVLVALSTSIAYFSSLIVLVFNLSDGSMNALGHSVLFRVSVMIITMVLLGKWLEVSAKRRAAAGVAALSSLQPEFAKLYDMEKDVVCHTPVPVNALVIGDVVRIIPGDKVPTDGEVVKGVSAVDESMLTGESNPVHKSGGDDVTGGTVNGNGSMVIRTTAVGEAAVLSQIVNLVNDAQEKRAPIEAYADRISAIFVPSVVAVSTLVFVVWYVLAQLGFVNEEWYAKEGMFFFSLLFALETMVIACPCALGLATPTAVMVASEMATKNGILLRGGAEAVENGSKIKAVVFDKTGTLTMGKPTVTEHFFARRCHDEIEKGSAMLAQLVYLIELESHHPLASAICNHIKLGDKLNSDGDAGFILSSLPKETPGRGIEAIVNHGRFKVRVGSPIFIYESVDKHALFTHSELKQISAMEKEMGLTIVIGVVNDRYAVVYGIEDTIRPEAAAVVRAIHMMGIKTALVTGDGSESGRIVGRRLGIPEDDIHIGATPAEKVVKVKQYEPSCFVGDGINDAAALTGATIGVAIGAGAPVAAESAPVVLVRADLWGVIDTIDLSKVTIRRIKLNFFWAIAYNLISVPVAAGLLYPFFKIRVPPMVASGAMALSSTCVIISSLALRWYRPKSRSMAARTELTEIMVDNPSTFQSEGRYGLNHSYDHDRSDYERPLLVAEASENV